MPHCFARSWRNFGPDSGASHDGAPHDHRTGGEGDARLSQNRRAWLIVWFFAILPLLGWWLYGLFDLDEGFYGAVVVEMNRRGEWITPFYNGHPWFEKPILLYWLGKPLVSLFGVAVGSRLPSILATIATYGLVAWFTRRRFDDHTARWCVLILSTSLLVVGVGRMMMTDALLSFCMAGALLTFWESLVGSVRWRWLAAFFLGLGVLAKGPVALLLFAPIAIVFFFREREFRQKFKGGWLLGTLIFALTVSSWYMPAYLANGQEFVQKFLIEQNLNRFTGGDQAHTLPGVAGYLIYFGVLLLGMMPWIFFLRSSVKLAWKQPLGQYLIIWAAIPFLFFSISKAKLPHYILPCCVPLAILIGAKLAKYATDAENSRSSLRPYRGAFLASVMVCLLANFAFIYYYNLFHREVHQLAAYVATHQKAGEDVDSYQMGRREKSMGTGKMKIQETSHPSLAMYLDQPIREPETIEQLLADPSAQWIITRWNRLSSGDIETLDSRGRTIREVKFGKQDLYRLYYLSAADTIAR